MRLGATTGRLTKPINARQNSEGGWETEVGCGSRGRRAPLTSAIARKADNRLRRNVRRGEADIARLKARMGWEMPWYTITDSFDVDFGVDEWHGHNVFFRDSERVFRTYFINNRGDEAMGSTWSYLDATPLGRQETWEDSPEGYPQSPPYKWWNWHDNYAAEASPDPKWVEVSDAGEAAFRNLDVGAKA
jgi:hypothetical protein